MSRKLFIQWRGMCIKAETWLSDAEIARRANQLGVTMKSNTQRSVTLACNTASQYFNVAKQF